MASIFLVDDFVSVSAGEPFRLFPFGKLVKGGIERNITPEMASSFKLPHFKPPIKLGSHNDETPAGGHIVDLLVKEDGLYAVPEFTQKGIKAIEEGDYRYHSPELIWEDGGLENPKTGEVIMGPLIVGDALLHTPHLGEATALYSVNPIEKGDNIMGDTVNVPATVFEKLFAPLLVKKEDPAPVVEQEDPEVVEVAKFEALQVEADAYKAKIEAMETKEKADALKATIMAEFDTEDYGMSYIELGKAEGAAEMLAKMDDEVRSWVMTNFKALSKQIAEGALMEEHGSGGAGGSEDNPVALLNAVVQAKSIEDKISYPDALALVQVEQPDLVATAYPEKEIK